MTHPQRNRLNPCSTRYQHVTFTRQDPAAPRPFTPQHQPPAPPDESLSQHAGLVRTVLSQAGVSAAFYRTETLERRIPACLRLLRAKTPDDARRKLRENRDLLAPAVSALLLGVTSYFRDPDVFDDLSSTVLPMLASQRQFLRIWSIGCSDGAEVYSLAILLAELGLRDRSYILGTDVRTDAITAAKSARVPPDSLSQIPPHLRAKYFIPPTRAGDPFTLDLQKLPAIGWWTHDALRLSQGGVWDLILCRNMVMYLAPAAAHSLWHFILNSLRPGGVLVTGRAERPQPSSRVTSIGSCLFQLRKGIR